MMKALINLDEGYHPDYPHIVWQSARRKHLKEIKHVRFNLYSFRRDYFIRVFIWPSMRKMHEGVAITERHYAACYIPGPDTPSFRKNAKVKFLGEMHFYRNFVSSLSVSHEMLHAVIDYSYKRKIKIDLIRNEYMCERLCEENGHLNRKFWQRYYRMEKKIKGLK